MRKWLNRIEFKQNRWIYIPTTASKAAGRNLVKEIRCKWRPPSYFFHFKKGGHIAALNAHRNSLYFSKIDIQDFFGSITASRITRTLKPLFGYAKAREMAKTSTVKRPDSLVNRLMVPYGFAQSAAVASICLDKSAFGLFLKKIHADPTYVISVYMDDIIISCDSDKDLTIKTQELKAALVKSHWTASPEKEMIARKSITAFNINLVKDLVEVCDARLQKFKFEYLHADKIQKKSAIAAYIKTVNEDQLAGLSEP